MTRNCFCGANLRVVKSRNDRLASLGGPSYRLRVGLYWRPRVWKPRTAEVPSEAMPNSRSTGDVNFDQPVVERNHVVLGNVHPVARQDLVVGGRRAALA